MPCICNEIISASSSSLNRWDYNAEVEGDDEDEAAGPVARKGSLPNLAIQPPSTGRSMFQAIADTMGRSQKERVCSV